MESPYHESYMERGELLTDDCIITIKLLIMNTDITLNDAYTYSRFPSSLVGSHVAYQLTLFVFLF